MTLLLAAACASDAPVVAQAAATAVSSEAAKITVTQVVVYKPAIPKGGEHKGLCFTGSLAAPRPGAWRCNITDTVKGGNLFDPCFQLPGESNAVICGANPVKGDLGFKVLLTGPLPQAPAQWTSNRGWGWVIQLEDGTICSFITGATFGIEEKRGNYACSDGDWILGTLTTGPIWTAEKTTVTNRNGIFSSLKSDTVSIRTVWQ
jgi:hypothetical protein